MVDPSSFGDQPSRRRRGGAARRFAAALTILALLLAACSGKDDPESGTPSGAPGSSEVTTPAPDESDLDAITSAGIVILAADGSTAYGAATPATGVELTVDEASALLAQARNRSGTTGATLDSLAPSRIPMSALLAAYARGVDTPAANLAASLLEPQDLTRPQTVVFPALVLTLFASDIAHAAGDQEATSLSLSAHQTVEGLCTDVTDALYKGINQIFDALHVEHLQLPQTGIAIVDGVFQGLADLFVDGVNYLIEAGRTLVIGIAHYTVAKVLAIIGKVAALAGMIGNFAVAIGTVHVKVVTDRDSVPKGTEGALQAVKATASATIDVGLGNLEWPQWFENCAELANAPLPKLKPEGEKVTWTITSSEPGLLFDSGTPGSPEPVLRDGGPYTAVGTWDLVTGTEPADAKGDSVSSVAVVTAVVQRSQVARLRDALVELGAGLLTDDLPPVIRGYLHDALVGIGKSATEGFVKLLSASGWTAVAVTYHEPGTKKQPQRGGEVWEGSWVDEVYDLAGTFRLDVRRTSSTMTGSLEVSGSPCLSAGELRAEVLGDQVEFGLVVGGVDQVTFSGVIEGNRVAGTFTSGPGCGTGSGPWQGVITPANR